MKWIERCIKTWSDSNGYRNFLLTIHSISIFSPLITQYHIPPDFSILCFTMSSLLIKTILASLASQAVAAPSFLNLLTVRQETSNSNSTVVEPWDAGAVTQYPIHSSCNATQAHQIALGLNETIELAEQAKQHVLRWSNNSEIYRKYFGDLPPFEVIGAYDIIVNGDKGEVLFRCDNPDGNCDLQGELEFTFCVFSTDLDSLHRMGWSLERLQCNRRDRDL